MFWMVLGSGLPTYRHDTEQSARAEAERLARQQAGQEFYVLQAVSACVKSDVAWVACEERDQWDDKLPF